MLRLQKFSARFIASESKNPNALGSLIFSNYYKLFNVPYNANKDEIKAAYLIKAKEFHPDRNPEDKNAAENFMKIRDAYNVMRDTNLRQKYDSELLKRGVGQTRAGAMATSQRPSSNTGPAGKIKFKPRVRTFDDGNAESEFDDQHLTFQQKRQFQRDELKKALHEWENMYKESFYSTSGNKNFSNKPPANSNQYQRPNFVNINLSNEQYKNWHNWANMHNKPIADEQKRQKNRFKSLIRAEPRPDDPHEYSLKNAHFRNYKSNYKGSAYLKNDNGSVYFGPGNPVENVTKQKLSYAESYYNDHMENYKSRADPHFKEYWKNVDAMNQQQFDKDLEQQPKASYDPGHRPFDKSKNSFSGGLGNEKFGFYQRTFSPLMQTSSFPILLWSTIKPMIPITVMTIWKRVLSRCAFEDSVLGNRYLCFDLQVLLFGFCSSGFALQVSLFRFHSFGFALQVSLFRICSTSGFALHDSLFMIRFSGFALQDSPTRI